MTRLHDELELIAQDAPTVDLAERALRRARRQRLTSALGAAVAVVAALAVGAAVLVSGPSDVRRSTATTVFSDVLPASGVEAARYAYYDFCGRQWDPGRNTAELGAKECAQWKIVTRGGQTYRVPEALSVYSEQSKEEYMNTGAPLEISSDGTRIAYYSEKDQKFAVRDLESGQIWLLPGGVDRKTLVAKGVLLQFSPDGRHLWDSLDRTIVEVETGVSAPVPDGWFVDKVSNGGAPAVVSGDDDRFGLLADGKVTPFPVKGTWVTVGHLAADGRTLAYLSGVSNGMESRPADSLVTVDTATGKMVREVTFKGAPEHFSPMRVGGWLNEDEILVVDSLKNNFRDRTPMLGDVTYAVNVTTGQVRTLETYSYKAWAGDLVIPGL
ncbi:hypothetical protein ACIBG8_51970 [Nonomuraea sp. NPDC050556]|uniref:hypothetical protein n=1 Tax=Nonomuraea sp. NPDC050556 TaxID=3364369 RepID=UPI0037ADBB08